MRYPASTSKVRKILERLGVPKPNMRAVHLIAVCDCPADTTHRWYLRANEEVLHDLFQKLDIINHLKRFWYAIQANALETAKNILRFCIEEPLERELRNVRRI